MDEILNRAAFAASQKRAEAMLRAASSECAGLRAKLEAAERERDVEFERAERVLAENQLLRRWLSEPPLIAEQEMAEIVPLTTAEVERVRWLERVAEAAKEGVPCRNWLDHATEGDKCRSIGCPYDRICAALAEGGTDADA